MSGSGPRVSEEAYGYLAVQWSLANRSRIGLTGVSGFRVYMANIGLMGILATSPCPIPPYRVLVSQRAQQTESSNVPQVSCC